MGRDHVIICKDGDTSRILGPQHLIGCRQQCKGRAAFVLGLNMIIAGESGQGQDTGYKANSITKTASQPPSHVPN